jgi:hypothetical protein
MQHKQLAYDFLVSLQERLNKRLPGPKIVRDEVSRRWNKPPSDKSPQEKLACKENLFLYHFTLPEIWHHVQAVDGINAERARESIRCEYFDKFPHLSSGNSRRTRGYPFPKRQQVSPEEVIEAWRRPNGTWPLNEAYPDLCLSNPCPFNVVFDAKFFEGEGHKSAEKALVEGVYEASHYRGLPAARDGSGAAAWDYDFGCLLAYDASEGAYLQQAWNSVATKRLFWNDAHVFVMIVRGASNQASENTAPLTPAREIIERDSQLSMGRGSALTGDEVAEWSNRSARPKLIRFGVGTEVWLTLPAGSGPDKKSGRYLVGTGFSLPIMSRGGKDNPSQQLWFEKEKHVIRQTPDGKWQVRIKSKEARLANVLEYCVGD